MLPRHIPHLSDSPLDNESLYTHTLLVTYESSGTPLTAVHAADRYLPGMSDLKQIGLRLPQALIDQIDADAAERHQGRSQWIRNACVAYLAGPEPSRNKQLVDDVEVVDERARALVKDLIVRVETLEAVLKTMRPDPFQ